MRTPSQVPVETSVPTCYRHHRVVKSPRQLGRGTRDALAVATGVLIHGSAIKTYRNKLLYRYLRISNRRCFTPQAMQIRTQNWSDSYPRKLSPAQQPSEFDHVNTRFQVRSTR